MISLSDVLLLHDFSINDYGGSIGVRDHTLLLSAIGRPFQTFDGVDLYPTPIEKAAALGESLIINHPFIDGNKRTALLSMAALLIEYGIELTAENEVLYLFIVEMAEGRQSFNEIVIWLQCNTK